VNWADLAQQWIALRDPPSPISNLQPLQPLATAAGLGIHPPQNHPRSLLQQQPPPPQSPFHRQNLPAGLMMGRQFFDPGSVPSPVARFQSPQPTFGTRPAETVPQPNERDFHAYDVSTFRKDEAESKAFAG